MVTEVKGSVVELGMLEITRFLPPPLLEGLDPETMETEDFLRLIAKARVVQELLENIVARAISDVFAE